MNSPFNDTFDPSTNAKQNGQTCGWVDVFEAGGKMHKGISNPI